MRHLVISSNQTVLSCSKIVLGTTYYGSDLSEERSFELMQEYIRLGGNCIDTARSYNIYSGENGADKSETTIGKWLVQTGLRDRIILSTKGGHNVKNGTPPRLAPELLNSDLNRSLELLQTDHTDLYWLHRDDPNRSVGEIMETLQSFIEDGRIRVPGASNWTVQRMAEANHYAASHGLTPFAAGQIQWSLALCRPEKLNDPSLIWMDKENYQFYLQHNLPVFSFSSQAKGFFSKLLFGGEAALSAKTRERFYTPDNLATAERVKSICYNTGLSATGAALHYITDNLLPAAAIVGCSTVEQLQDSMKESEIYLSPEQIRFLRDPLA